MNEALQDPKRHSVRAVSTLSALAISAALTLTACGQDSGAQSAADSFSVAVPSSYLEHFVPGQAGESDIVKAIYMGLTQVDSDGKVQNAVAKSMTTTDQKTWTIKLNSDWTFHNGEPVTAQSFADSWNATAYAPNAMGFNYVMGIFEGYDALNPTEGAPDSKTMAGVEVLDDYTLKVTLASRTSDFPYIVAGTAFAPMPESAFKDLKSFDQMPVGNGPYEVASPGAANGTQEITLKRYDDYAGEDGKAKEITVRAYKDTSTAFTSFRSSAVDIASVDGNNLVNASKQYKDQLVTQAAPAVVFLGFPSWDPRFKDKRVREAFSLAIDRDAIVEHLLGGFAEPAKDVAPDTLPGGGGDGCTACTYDPERAKKLLQEAGGWQGPLKLWTKQDPTFNNVLESILNQLRENLGIEDISLEAQPTGDLYSSLYDHKIDGPFLLYTGVSYPTLYSQVDQLFGRTSVFNVTGYKNDSVAAELANAARASSPEKATSDVQKASAIALGDLPLTPLYYPVTGIVHAPNLSDVSIDFLAEPRLAQIDID